MSRIGKLPVAIPQGIKVVVNDNIIVVEGPKGKLEQKLLPEVGVLVEGNEARVSRINDSKPAKSRHGLYRNLLQNMILGVSQGFQKTLIINGVGYRAELKGKSLMLNLGYSTNIEYCIPEGITIACEGNNKVIVSGISKEKVGQAAAEIRSLRTPEPYKGKGIKYENEVIVQKVGKTGVK